METETENKVENQVEETKIDEQNKPLGDIIKKKKDKKKAKKEKLLAELDRKRKFEDFSREANSESAEKKIKFDNVFDAQKAVGRKGRDFTVSLALAGSILDNAQSAELRTYLAGQIARALAVFNIDEVIVFSDDKENEFAQGNSQLVNILKYLECPQYLRKDLFPIHRDLKFAGVLNPTDMPHHLRAYEESEYREGVVLDRKSATGNSLASIGLRKDCELDKKDLEAGLRVTVKIISESKKVIKGNVVTPSIPREEAGLYWGYSVRFAPTLTSVFTKSPFQGGYDLTLGTSERGQNVDKLESLPQFKHLLIVFGGVKGLEVAVEIDPELKHLKDPEPLFDVYLNTCPNQGSRTIRTEEAILVSLAALRPKIWKS